MARRVANVIWFLNSEHILLDESLRLQLLSTLPSNFIGTHEICAVVVVILMTMQLTDMQIAIHSLCDVYPRPLTIWFNLCFVYGSRYEHNRMKFVNNWSLPWQLCQLTQRVFYLFQTDVQMRIRCAIIEHCRPHNKYLFQSTSTGCQIDDRN